MHWVLVDQLVQIALQALTVLVKILVELYTVTICSLYSLAVVVGGLMNWWVVGDVTPAAKMWWHWAIWINGVDARLVTSRLHKRETTSWGKPIKHLADAMTARSSAADPKTHRAHASFWELGPPPLRSKGVVVSLLAHSMKTSESDRDMKRGGGTRRQISS